MTYSHNNWYIKQGQAMVTKGKSMLEKNIVISLAIIIFLIFLLLRVTQEGPKLEFEEYSKDLGEVLEEMAPNVVFKFRNKGSKQLIIYELQGSCNCQNLKVTKSKISPGEEGELHAKIIPKTKGGPATDTIRIKTNDNETPVQIVEIKRFVIKHTLVEPDKLVIKNLTNQHPFVRKVTILGPTGNREFKIHKVESDDRRITSEFVYIGRTDEDRSIWELKVTLNSQNRYSKKETKNITLFTSEKERPNIILPVLIEENVPIQLTPKSLSFIIRDSTQSDKRQIKVVCNDTEYFNVPPKVYSPDYICIALVSTKIKNCFKEWIYEIKIVPETSLKTPVQTDKIEFSFQPSDISLFVPISVMKLKGNSLSQLHSSP